jgi:serine/threonine protein kinase/WD40 repeat protein
MADMSEDRDVLLNRLADEFALRQRNGERPRLAEFCDRHPSLADDIRSLFPAMVELERVKADAGPELAVAASDTPPITELGDFRLLREVGRGGMGVVYEAEQVSLGRRVAIKVLPAAVFRDRSKRRRFEREAKAAARLHHTNIVPVHGFGEHNGTPYYVMQFIPGLGLDAVIDELGHVVSSGQTARPVASRTADQTALSVALARSLIDGDQSGTGGWNAAAANDHTLTSAEVATFEPAPRSPSDISSVVSLSASGMHLPGQSGPTTAGTPRKKTTYWESVARIGVQVAGALAYAHKLGVLHRDIKPANLLLDLDGIVWVTDFGLAKADDSDNLTHTGDLLGTLRYMPPEAFEAKSDARGDIYSLGLTLFELVALRPAYEERDQKKLIKQVTTGEPARLRKLRKDAPRDLVTIVEKAIDREPDRRYQHAADLAADLQRFLDDQPIKARRQTTAETVWRWARHHRMVASLAAVVLLLLVALTIGAVVTAAYFRDLEKEQRLLVQTKATLVERTQQLAEENEAAKKRAEDAHDRAETTLVDMQTGRGLLAAERDDPARALLWFAKAAEEGTGSPERRADNRLRARNWARNVTVPLRAFPLSGAVRVLEFRPGGDLLLALADDRLFVRDWRQDKCLLWADDIPKVGAIGWSPDGDLLAIGYHTGVVQIRGVPDGRILQEVNLPGAITALAFSPNGQHLACAGTEVRDWRGARTVTPWDLAERKSPVIVGETVVRVLSVPSRTLLPGEWKHPQPVYALAFNRAGNRLITASTDKKARVFAIGDGADRPAPLFEPIPHEPRFPWPPALVENDRRLITVQFYGLQPDKPTSLACWDLETGKPAGPGTVQAQPTYPPRVVAGGNGDWFATAGHFGHEVWKAADPGTKSVYVNGHTHYVQDLATSPDGKTVLTASWDQTARFWSVPEGRPLGSPLPHMGRVIRCTVAGDNLHLATLADGLVRVWRRADGDVAVRQDVKWWGIARPSFDRRLIAPGIWHEEPLTFRPTGSNKLQIYDATAGTNAGPAIELRGQFVDSCVCADNSTVAAVAEERETGWLSLTDVSTGQARTEPIRLPGSPRSVAARPSSTQVAVLCAGGELLVFDTLTGELVLNLNHDGQSADSRMSRVEYTADGRTLVSLTLGGDQIIYIRDAATGRPNCPPIHPVPTSGSGPCRTFALSADGRMLATAVNGKNAAQVWDVATGRALSQPLPHPGEHFGLFCLCFSPDGRRLLTGSKDGQARLWDWQAATLACPTLKHDEEVFTVAMTPDGRFAITAGRDRASRLHVWELTTGRLIAPKVQLPNSVVSLFCSSDGARLVAGSIGSFARIDLAKLIAPPELPTEDYRLLGELASGQRIEQGDESGLTQDQWLQRLDQFNQRNSK